MAPPLAVTDVQAGYVLAAITLFVLPIAAVVFARNERRMRRGEAPLDVEAETERQLADL